MTHEEIQTQSQVQDGDDYIKMGLLGTCDGPLVLIYLQRQNQACNYNEGKDQPQCLFPE